MNFKLLRALRRQLSRVSTDSYYQGVRITDNLKQIIEFIEDVEQIGDEDEELNMM